MVRTSQQAAVEAVLARQVESGRLPGFVAAVRHRGATAVLTGGRLACGSPAPMAPDTLFRLASVTKLVAGALTLALVADGVLGLDEPVGERLPEPGPPRGGARRGWLPEWPRPRATARRGGPLDDTVPAVRPITLRHLLTNTAGLGWAPDLGPL